MQPFMIWSVRRSRGPLLQHLHPNHLASALPWPARISGETLASLENGSGRKLGRPGGTTAPCHGRPYEVIFIVSGRRLWRHDRLLRKYGLSPGPEQAKAEL